MNQKIEVFNLLLHFKYKSEMKINKEGIFEFANNRIVAINEVKYKKEKRKALKIEYKLKAYYITDTVFEKILKNVCLEENNKFKLRSIKFDDRDIQQTAEYENIVDAIKERDFKEAYMEIKSLKKEYDTNIRAIKLFFEGYDLEILADGRIEMYATTQIAKKIMNDEVFNKLILGVS